MKKIVEKAIELYFLVLYEIKYKIYVLKSGDRFKKQFEQDLYHDKLMEAVLNKCDTLPKYNPKNDENHVDWYVGSIPKDWEERIDMKIAQKNKEAEKE